MTVIVGITTPDGVLLASDSRTTQSGEGGHRIISDSAHKVFEVGPFGVATSGLAFIGENTIAGLMDQFLAQLEGEAAEEVDAFTDALGEFFHARFSAWLAEDGESWDVDAQGFPLRFFVAGYDTQGIGHIHEVQIPGPERGDYSPNTTDTGTMWRGQTDVISRLLKGVDRSQLQLPLEQLSKEVVDDLVDSFDSLEYLHLFPITLQDAVDYSSFLIRTTIDMQRFSDGTVANPGLVPGCGGPLQIFVVERSRTRWAARPELRAT
jgi:hypothetical protein